MSEIRIAPVLEDREIGQVAALAKKIWYHYYSNIIDESQIEYMVNKYQSKKAIKAQIAEQGYRYFVAELDGVRAGYFGIQIQKREKSLFLSKLYVDKDYRKKGIGRHVIDFLSEMARENKLSKIWLTVNRNNKASITAYEHLGFTLESTLISDIGEGFVMDDYVMEKKID